ncbi:lytic transglycosylase domain-containing protein [Halorhodospira halophila]|uniref:lytic transglycosylase domain-containing protein n=1 Tax=Halorhodospira halophila TaxID=1053 RepID=UPI001912F769|nr:transglycosylase SLT domain-containing protein [Halorhodospira halophila]MBK5943332.1 hypothetical protein [Halorhodospira halophila]
MHDIDQLTARFSERYGIPVRLLRAIIEVESAGNPYAMRMEANYRWLWDVRHNAPHRGGPFYAPPGASRPTESYGQRTSWGLMQIMGATAREIGFKGTFLSELCDPETNLQYGCEYLMRLYRRFGNQHGWTGVAAAYNAGSPRMTDGRYVNQEYVDRLIQAGWEE